MDTNIKKVRGEMNLKKYALLVAILPASLLPATSAAALGQKLPSAGSANSVVDGAGAQAEWANEFGFFADQMREKFPETFASAAVDDSGSPLIRFTQAIPEEAQELASELSVKVLFEQYSGRSESEIKMMVPTVHYEALDVARESGVADVSQFSTEYSEGEDVVHVNVPQDISAALAASMERSAHDALASLASRATEGMPAVKVSPSSPVRGGGDVVRGGAVVGGCTSGWPVVSTNGSGVGIITADHCDDVLTYEGRNILEYRRSMAGSNGDIQFMRSTESAHRSFYYTSSGSTRNIGGNRSPFLGETLCKYGKTSQETCDTVHEFFKCRGVYCNLVNMANRRAAPGDSGGPWYSGDVAIGVHSGYVCLLVCSDQFTPIRDNIGPNLSVNIAP